MGSRALTLFDALPPGFLLEPDFISEAEEQHLLQHIGATTFSEVRMRGVVARRRVRQFGWHYSFESYGVTEGEPLPEFLLPLRAKAAALAEVLPERLSEGLLTEYRTGATIGWHRDAPVFGVVVGISLLAACTFKLRRAPGDRSLAIELPARSAYVLDGEVRSNWQHSIPATSSLRYSVTFRTLRGSGTRNR